MDNYNFDRLEKLKVQFYTVIGRLELDAGVLVNNEQLEIFETAVQNCKSENEAAACILGNTRRFESMLVSKCAAKVDEETDQKAAASATSKNLLTEYRRRLLRLKSYHGGNLRDVETSDFVERKNSLDSLDSLNGKQS